MIVSPEAMSFDDSKFSMIIYGSPGVGKTTLAMSAPKPVIIDFDRGLNRVKAQHRVPAIFCETYEDVLADLSSAEMKDFETVIVDTGGAFVSYLQAWAIKKNPTVNAQKDGVTISMKGFGAVKSEFQHFTSYVKDTLHKNLIYVFHSTEQQDRSGATQVRLMCEGSAKNIVWTPCDFGGYVQMIGNKRVICFSPEQEFFAKGCHGISGQMGIPELKENDANDFISKLFDKAKANIAAESAQYAPLKAQYEQTMETVKGIIDGVTDADTATKAVSDILALTHALTSKKEASKMLNDKANTLGLIFKDGKAVKGE